MGMHMTESLKVLICFEALEIWALFDSQAKCIVISVSGDDFIFLQSQLKETILISHKSSLILIPTVSQYRM